MSGAVSANAGLALALALALALPEAASATVTRVALDAGALASRGAIELEAAPDAVSLLLTLVLEDDEHVVGVTRVTAPDGTVLHDTVFERDSWEARRFASELATEPIVGTGELALQLSPSPRTPLVPGTYRVELETDPPDATFARAARIVRHDPDGAAAAARAHVVDVHVHVLHPQARWRGARFARTLDANWRAVLDAMLTPHALAIGTTSVSVSPLAPSVRLSELDGEREIAEACRAIRDARPDRGPGHERARTRGPGSDAASGPATDPPAPTLHVGLVAEIIDAASGHGGEDWTTGLSPQPGPLFDDASPSGCVFIAERAWTAGELDADTVVELLAANLLHELGHFVGLAHPSEADGMTFDLLDDTPRCTHPDAVTCGVDGGANNVMFHSGDASTRPWTLTADQAWVLRRHPLFRPAEASAR